MHIDKNEKKRKQIRRNVSITAMITVGYSIKIIRDSYVKSNEKMFKYHITLWTIFTNIAVTNNIFDSVITYYYSFYTCIESESLYSMEQL